MLKCKKSKVKCCQKIKTQVAYLSFCLNTVKKGRKKKDKVKIYPYYPKSSSDSENSETDSSDREERNTEKGFSGSEKTFFSNC